jgi:two-component system CheB/CheR fusion protein
MTDLEQELNVARSDLQGAKRSLEISGEEQKATNEQLAVSRKELQLLSEELADLNNQIKDSPKAAPPPVPFDHFPASNHDLRQPLQSLSLLQALLARTVEGERAQELVARLGAAVGTISGMLKKRPDQNLPEEGKSVFPISDILVQLRDEFIYTAQAQGLALRVVPCDLSVNSDPRLLEQMIRGLLDNAMKYTPRGKVLLGCRRHKEMLSIEIWDTGVGIPDRELQTIFDEYHQLDAVANGRARGLGLGLSVVRRLGHFLGHPVRVRSRLGIGSVFTIDVSRPMAETIAPSETRRAGMDDRTADGAQRTGMILIIGDDPEKRGHLDRLLKADGHFTSTATDGIEALQSVKRGAVRLDLILVDYNLHGAMNGLQVAATLRERLQRQVPVIILTDDASAGTLRNIMLQNCLQLQKSVRPQDLLHAIQRLLPMSQAAARPSDPHAANATDSVAEPVIYVVDDDGDARAALHSVLVDAGLAAVSFESCEAFLAAHRPSAEGCLLIDAMLPGMDGFALLKHMQDQGHRMPAIMITGNGDVHMAVRAMQAGALDFIEKPVSRDELLASIERALARSRDSSLRFAGRDQAASHIAGLTARQHQIMDMVLAGYPSRRIATDLRISQRTVENHRASIMQKTGSKSLPELARIVLAAAASDAIEPNARPVRTM